MDNLQIGDVILEVNETPIKDLTQQDIMMLLRSVAPDVKLMVCRPPEGELPSIQELMDEIEASTDAEIRLTPKTHLGTPVNNMYNASDNNKSQEEQDHSHSDHSISQFHQSLSRDSEGSEGEEDEVKSGDSIARTRTPSPVKEFLHDAGLDSDSFPPTTDTVGGDSEDSQPLKPGEFEVELTKGEKGLGFTVAGGQNTTGFFYIKDVLYDPARSAGCLKSGDRLLMVNGWDMTGMTHHEAVSFLRETPPTVNLRFYRAPTSTSPTSNNTSAIPASPTSPTPVVQSTSPKGKELIHASNRRRTPTNIEEALTSPASSFGNVSLPLSEGQQTHRITPSPDTPTENGALKIELHRTGDQSWGFSLVQGEKGSVSALYVKSLAPGGLAAMDGRMLVGDRLLQVNGESVIGMPHNKAVALIKKSRSSMTLTLSRSGHPSSARNTPSIPMPEVDQNKTNKPGMGSRRQLSYDTDSDVDSTTFDEEQEAKSHEHSTKFSDQSVKSHVPTPTSLDLAPDQLDATRSEDDDDDTKTFDSLEGEEALNRFVRVQRQAGVSETEEDEDDSWAEESRALQEEEILKKIAASPKMPVKPPRRNPLFRLPAEISQSWLDSLELASPPPDTVHYSGSELAATCRALQSQIDNDKPIQEYKNLKHAKLTDNCLVARREDNKPKNRFRNVLPYDANRVKLIGEDDYINASHVRFNCGQKQLHYIASQGPLPQTSGDFWKMVWEQRVEVIAMVTKDVEEGKMKCHLYWPDVLGAPFIICNRYEVSLTQVHTLQHFTVHHIKMEDLETGRVHRVTHLYFTAWPDHGSPVSGIPLLQYIRFLHLVHESGPIIVHCSAGIGRTGVLLTLDIILSHIQADLKFDVKQLVQNLRRQRQGLIQTTDQYNFCYRAVLDALQRLS